MKFTQKAKYFVSGFAACSILTASLVSFAEPIEKQISAIYNNIKIYVDGKLVDPKDGQGNKVEPFIYNGTTYLPIRAVGQAFDKNVDWDGKTNSVYIGKKDSTSPSVWLSSLDYFNKQSTRGSSNFEVWNAERDKDSTGMNYPNGIKYNMWIPGWDSETKYSQYVEYLVNQKYTRLKGSFVLHYDYRTANHECVFKVYGDDKLLYTSPIMKAGQLPSEVDVDITGVVKLKTEVEIKDMYNNANNRFISYGFVNAGLY